MTSRPYEPGDLLKLQSFTAESAARTQHCGYLHPGDIPHRFFNALRDYDVKELVRVWEDQNGEVIGWALVYPRFKGFDIQVHPDYRGGELEVEILNWAENAVRGWMKKLDLTGKLGSDVDGCDTTKIDLLKQHGYTPSTEPTYLYTERELAEPIPDPVLPEGFYIRCAEGEHEAGALAEVHAGAFKSSWTAEKYLKVMRSPGYNVEREMVVVAPDGRFAAFCIYWFDHLNKSVLFEPVGVHEDFQRHGLGRALMLHVMHRMKAQGIERAVVAHETDNPAAAGLYANVGFKPVYSVYYFSKEA